ncbi:hypothetical protein KYE_16708 [Marinobacter manganoxydans MnI7-9]|uniref:Uncharacterized protein n=1 Tax=Marinobacter manganoxydans MnI7-9 TaxID=1094979 RepID=G6YWS8_9GAMM|nr:hypothetical protein KYE_16708 [Marinobacter manganoxydans MnI7-9]
MEYVYGDVITTNIDLKDNDRKNQAKQLSSG